MVGCLTGPIEPLHGDALPTPPSPAREPIEPERAAALRPRQDSAHRTLNEVGEGAQLVEPVEAKLKGRGVLYERLPLKVVRGELVEDTFARASAVPEG